MQIVLYLVIIFDLFDKVLHTKLWVVRKGDSIDLIVLKASFLASQHLADERAVHIVVFIHVTLTINEICEMIVSLLTIE